MTFKIPAGLEASLRRFAIEKGCSVDDVIADALSRVVQPISGTDNNGVTAKPPRSLKGTVLKYDDPYGPALPDSHWESLH